MSENHLEPLVNVVTGTAEQASGVPQGNSEPPAISSSLETCLGAMNTKMGVMADLIGKLCSSLDERDRQATGQTSPQGKNGGKSPRATTRPNVPLDEISSSDSEESDEVMSVCASEEDLDRLVGGNDTSAEKTSTQSASEKNTNDSVLHELEAAITDDDILGPEIDQALADLALKRWGKKLSQEKLKALLSKHEVPANCAKMVVPRVNNEIWTQLNSTRRTNDLRLSNVQKSLLKATSAVMAMCDKVLALKLGKDDQKRVMADGVDTIGILSNAVSDISGFRKEQMKPALKSDFHSLCSKELDEPTTLLFGNDLAKEIRDAKEATRIGVAVGHSKQDRQRGELKRRHTDYYRNNQSYKKPFLSKGHKNQGYRKKQRNPRKTDDMK